MKNNPRHIAIVMDGNGRWAKQHKVSSNQGHKAGAEALRRVIKAAVKNNIEYLSVYAFSTENWSRPVTEVSFLMKFFKELLEKETGELHHQGVKIQVLGSKKKLSKGLLAAIKHSEDQTKSNLKLVLNLHMNYGSRDEIIRATQKLVDQSAESKSFKVTESLFEEHLDTKGIPVPEILIRTSDEYRLSNFLLWQLAYTELFFLDVLWPDFTENHLERVIEEYKMRDRRFGGRK